MPAFHHQQLHSYRDDMVAITQSEIEQIKMNEPCEINQLMKRLTLRIATQSLFGVVAVLFLLNPNLECK
jgi:cytochrome P450